MSPAVALARQHLPRPAPARVLALGAFLKNRACLVAGDTVLWSPLHGDLGTPASCAALAASAEALLAAGGEGMARVVEADRGALVAGGAIDAVAHDLHPDFFSTRLARETAAHLGVPAIAVQHHHAHLAVVQAEHAGLLAPSQPLVGLALDGVGLGDDGTAWGGEVLRLDGARCTRVAHLPALALPGGDIAAREPWRLVAAVLHAAGRGEEIEPRLAPYVGSALARGVATMLARGLNCPRTTSAGRWFDAAAGALCLSVRQGAEAEAARSLEAAAARWLAQATPGEAQALRDGTSADLDLLSLVASFTDDADLGGEHIGRAAALFHFALACSLVAAVGAAAAAAGTREVALGGGCFFNRVLAAEIEGGLAAIGLHATWPRAAQTGAPAAAGRGDVGDAGLALGQAWAAGLALQAAAAAPTRTSADLSAPALET